MRDELFLRSFRPEDEEQVRALILQGLAERWGRADESKNPDLADIAATYGDAIFLTAWLAGELVGTGALVRESPGVGRIVRMSVVGAFRGRGIGTAILNHLLAAAKNLGDRRVVLETTETWTDAIAFYERHGFRRVGASKGDLHFVLELKGGDDG